MIIIVVWALLTGLITGGVWVAIVLRQQQARLNAFHRNLVERMDTRLALLEGVEDRLAEIEERLDFTERVRESGPARDRLPGS